jgi:hypothetical protein
MTYGNLCLVVAKYGNYKYEIQISKKSMVSPKQVIVQEISQHVDVGQWFGPAVDCR